MILRIIKNIIFTIFLVCATWSMADWVSIQKDDEIDLGLSQEWNIPPLRDEYHSLLMTRHSFEIGNSGAWESVWDWCNQEYTNRCTPKNKNWTARYVNIYKIDCFTPAKKFQIINSYWIGLNGEELHWNMGVDPNGEWVSIVQDDILDKRLIKYGICEN